MDRLSIDAPITMVTAYLQQARVTRQGQVTLPPGEHHLILAPLPPTLEPASVQVGCYGAAAQLQAVMLQPLCETATQPSAAELTAKIQQLEQQQQRQTTSLATLQVQHTFLHQLAQHCAHTMAEGLAQKQLTLEDIQRLLAFLQQRLEQVLTAMTQHEQQQQQLAHTLQTLQTLRQQQSQADSSEQQPYGLQLDIQTQQAGDYTLTVSYGVSGVSWSPCYDARLDTQAACLYLQDGVQIQQHSGEDWFQVALELSTAPPPTSQAVAPPTWMLWLNHPNFVHRRPPHGDDTRRLMGAVPGSELRPAPLNGTPDPSPSAATTTIRRINLEGVYTLPDQTSAHILPGTTYPLACQVTYQAFPQCQDRAHLTVTITIPDQASPLLPGVLRRFRDGVYLGNDHLPPLVPGQALEMTYGAADPVRVQRCLVGRKQISTPMNQVTLSYRLLIANDDDQPITVTLVEQLPLSQDEQIRVKFITAQPQPQESGASQLRWQVSLGAHTTDTIDYQIVIESPAGIPLVGLDPGDGAQPPIADQIR